MLRKEGEAFVSYGRPLIKDSDILAGYVSRMWLAIVRTRGNRQTLNTTIRFMESFLTALDRRGFAVLCPILLMNAERTEPA